MKHVSIRITGKVQGVFFRASAQQKAIKLNVKGFVKNEPDGSICIEVEGDENELNQFIDWCHQGSPRSTVDRVAFVEVDFVGYKNFEIKR